LCRNSSLPAGFNGLDQGAGKIKETVMPLTEETLTCGICGLNHATWEHRIYEKLRLVEIGVPPENLFLIIPDELEETDAHN